MITTSDIWKDAVRESGRRITVADLYYNHQPVPTLMNLEVISCSTTIDLNAANRRTGSITLANTDLVTENTTASLEPYGFEIGIRSGVVYPDTTTELVKVGMFPFETTEWADEAGSIPTLTLYDRSYLFATQSSQNGWTDYAGRTYLYAIANMLTTSALNFVATVSAKVDPTTVGAGDIYLVVDAATQAKDIKVPGGAPIQGATYWDNMTAFAAVLGAHIYFDVDGVNLICEQIPVLDDTDTDYVATVDVGERGNMLAAQRSLSRNGAYNAVQATGPLPANAATAQIPPSVFVYDSNPKSKTYYYGPFGKIVLPVTSDTITTKTGLLAFANTTLKKGLGLAKSVAITVLADASLNVGDIIKVSFLDGTSELHMILTIEHDHVSGVMSLTTYSQNQG